MKSAIDEALETNHNKFDGKDMKEDDDMPNLPMIPAAKFQVVIKDVDAIDVEQDTKDDYTNARNVAASLLEQQQELIKSMTLFLNTCPSPRAFEVMNNMMKTADELGKRLLGVQIQLKEAQEEAQSHSGGKGGDTFVFTGGPSNILKALEKAAVVENDFLDGETE